MRQATLGAYTIVRQKRSVLMLGKIFLFLIPGCCASCRLEAWGVTDHLSGTLKREAKLAA